MAAGWRRRTSIVALVGLLGLAVLTASPAAEAVSYAPSIGSVTGAVATGPTSVAPQVVTTAPCPSGTFGISAFVDGNGLVKAVAIPNAPGLQNGIDGAGVQFQFNLLDIAASQGKTLVNGTYDVALICQGVGGLTNLGQFDGQFAVIGGATPTAQGTSYTWAPGGSVRVTTTTLTTSPAGNTTQGGEVTLTATIGPADAAGTVAFKDTLGTATTDLATVTVASGTATLSVRTLAAGTHQLSAAFTPSDPHAFAASSSPPVSFDVLTQDQKATTTTLTADPAVGVTKGGTVTLTAAVTPADAAGTVTFVAGGTTLTQAAVTSGQAKVTLQPTTSGTLSLTAQFTPTNTVAYLGSRSATVEYLVADPFSEGPYVDDLVINGPSYGSSSGVATSGMQLTAPQACPAPATLISVRVQGPGAWALGVSVSATGDYNEPKGTVFTEALADTAARNSLAITPGRYLFAVTCRVPGTNVATGFFLGRLWFYDSLRWLNQDPAVVGVPTTTTVTVAPSGRQVVSNKVEINAILDPADSSGSVVFEAVSGTSILPVGAATIKNGTATFSVSNLDLGLYYLTGTYTPDGTNNPGHNGSHSKEIILAITKGLPPIPAREAAVTGTAKVGSKLTCASGFSGQQVSVTYQWFRDGAAVAGSAVTRTSVAADAGHLLTCRATATNPGGTVYRDSPAVRVGV